MIGVDVDELFEVTAGPVGGLPEAMAVFATTPAFTSDCVIVLVAVHVVENPGSKIVAPQLIVDRPGSGSVMATEVRVTLPVLPTAKVNVWISPTDGPVGAVSVVSATDFTRLIVLA